MAITPVRELAEELRNRSENQAITSDEKQSLWKIQRAKKARLLGGAGCNCLKTGWHLIRQGQ